jgi:hypothetical protein
MVLFANRRAIVFKNKKADAGQPVQTTAAKIDTLVLQRTPDSSVARQSET